MYIIPYSLWTNFTPALPSFYWDVYSSEQRIKAICKELNKIDSYDEYLAEVIGQVDEDSKQRDIDYYNRVHNELIESHQDLEQQLQVAVRDLMQLISTLQISSLDWDCQIGEEQASVVAMRDMFNDVTLHSYNCEQLEGIFDELNMTVDGLADCGLNVKGYALVNHVLKEPEGITQDLIWHDGNRRFTVNGLRTARVDTEGYVYVENP